MIYRSSPDDELSQGDIIRRVRVLININDDESHEPQYGPSNIIVMSRNCEISKPSSNVNGTNSILVARVVRLSAAPQNLRGNIKRNRVENKCTLEKAYFQDCMEDFFLFLTKPDPAEVAQSQITVTNNAVDVAEQN